MRITQKSLVITKIDLDLTDRKNPGKETQAHLTRDKSVANPISGTNDYLIRLISSYHFVFDENKNVINFLSVFKVNIDDGEVIDFDNERLDGSLDAIVTPQEISLIRGIFSNFGINIKDGLPLGSEFIV
ncbi:hypothetical protein N5D77_22925 [Comamonas thiooxydans]|uniref:Uncharacterized protein n=1 Tax=Comamonas thiooxydans TaxID=363952 RepID=A0AA42Q6J8_9BURK|nr:hypothetical protein [Comamonas thiooxydans]MDH1337034.1 hypothetical protein [Comamonas thiooxydans]MDH1743195.1 hypothetical protein [Comamonas thiooxydans]MDH1789435.1 hypothetical protein [Comamonas thiooxydans]